MTPLPSPSPASGCGHARCAYIYDYGAWWHHDVRLERLLAPEPRRMYPLCSGGKHAGPPEDCAGPDTYRTRVEEATSFTALDDLALVADVVGRWLDHDQRGTEDVRADVAAAIERMQARRHLILNQFDQRAVNAVFKQLLQAVDDGEGAGSCSSRSRS